MAAIACGKQAPEEVESAAVVTVKTAPAAVGSIRGVVHATGVVTPAPGAELVVIPAETARIAEMPKAVGDRVRPGDVLVRFEIPTAAAEVERQQADVGKAQAAVETARAAQTRARELFEHGVAARRDVEDSTRAMAEAEAALTSARASLTAAQTVAARAVVRATFDGIVARRTHNPGDLVEPGAADPVLRVIDPHRLEVVASVPLADATRVVVNAPARLAAAPTGEEDAALTVVSRPASVEAGTATVPVRLRFAAATRLPAGAPVQVEIEAEQHANAVLVPSSAIVRDGDDTAVFVAAGGKAQRRAVRLGLTDGEHVEVSAGLKAGEAVIVEGQNGLPDGATIKEQGAAEKEQEKDK